MNPYIGEIRLLAFEFAPRTWAQCNGQLLSIQQNTALFSLLGTTYGGNGINNFALPDLRGRAGMHRSTNGQYPQGASAGVEQETLQLSEMPQHFHAFNGTSGAGNARRPINGRLATPSVTNNFYAADTNTLQPLIATSISPVGSGQSHNNMQPYLVMNYCIALQGIFPSRN